ncbi:MAG: hypothetical protein WCO49_20560, partial [Nostocales cyanobacterium ELA608]
TFAVAIGNNSGYTSQGSYGVAIGVGCGLYYQADAIAIGSNAGTYTQARLAIAIGLNCAITNQGQSAIAIGYSSGRQYQGQRAVAIGEQASYSVQGTQAVSLGFLAGTNYQGQSAVAIGDSSGAQYQGTNSIAIGYQAGYQTQGTSAVAIGYQAGYTSQGQNTIAIGYQAGATSQGSGSIAIGYQAGNYTQGVNSIAIGVGAGLQGQFAGSIIINGSGTTLNAAAAGFYVSPIRNITNANFLSYNTSTNEITYFSTTAPSSSVTTTSTTSNINYNIAFLNPSSGASSIYYDGSAPALTYNPSTDTLQTSTLNVSYIAGVSNGNISGNLIGSPAPTINLSSYDNNFSPPFTTQSGGLYINGSSTSGYGCAYIYGSQTNTFGPATTTESIGCLYDRVIIDSVGGVPQLEARTNGVTNYPLAILSTINVTGGITATTAASGTGGVPNWANFTSGSFTPTVQSAGGGTPTYTTQTGNYTRVGNTVTFQAFVVLATLGTLAAGNIRISLPVTTTVATSQTLTIGRIFNMTTAIVSATAITSGAVAYGNIYQRTAAASSDAQTAIAN